MHPDCLQTGDELYEMSKQTYVSRTISPDYACLLWIQEFAERRTILL